MAFPTLEEFGNVSEGLHVIFLYVAHIVPIFIPLTLFVFFTIILLATFFSQQRLIGRGDFPASFTVAGFATTVLSIFMMLIPKLIYTETIVICLVITLLGVIWLFVSRER